MNSKLINFVPDATVVGSIILAYFLDRTFPVVEIVPSPVNLVGWFLIVVGVVLTFHTISVIRRQNTTSNVTDVPPAIMTNGLYAFSRNPFYLSYVVIVLGAALVMGSLAGFVAPVICIAVLQFIIIPIEERALQKAFEQTYQQYKRSVRRWL